jgi:hypothetical protein
MLTLPAATLLCWPGRQMPHRRVLAEAAERLRKPIEIGDTPSGVGLT